MHTQHHDAGATSAYAVLSGLPTFHTSADFARGFREQVTVEIERLIDLLDTIDGTVDDDREYDVADDRHGDEGEDREPDEGREPSLGAPANHHDQTKWAAGYGDDSEDNEDSGLADDGALNLFWQEQGEAVSSGHSSPDERDERAALLHRARQLAGNAMRRQGGSEPDPDEVTIMRSGVAIAMRASDARLFGPLA